MFRIIYWNRLKSTFRSRDMLVWTWVFPIMLSTLFFFAFSELDSANNFEAVNTAVVDDSAYRAETGLRETLDEVSKEGDGQLLSLTLTASVAEADALLEQGKVDGYLVVQGGTPELKVKADGIGQTILKSFLDQYLQTASAVGTIAKENPAALGQEGLFERTTFTSGVSITQSAPSDKVNYFYALLAMVCLYGGFQGLRTVTMMQANLSPLGARRSVSPAPKLRAVTYDLLGGLTVQFAAMMIVVGYINLVLGVNFGNQFGLVLLVCLFGSLIGVGLGAAVGALFRWHEQVKTALLVTVTMVCCFLAGLMVGGINYTIEQSAPVLAWLNPAARIADAFYCLYYYDTYARFFQNIAVLAAMSVVLFIVAGLALRRKAYESI